jgi:hypothetical protein
MAEHVAFNMKNYYSLFTHHTQNACFQSLPKRRVGIYWTRPLDLMQQIRVNVPLVYAILKILPFLSDSLFWQEPLPNGKQSKFIINKVIERKWPS